MFWTNRNDMVPGEGVGSPGQRVHHAMAYDSDRGVTVLFGGEFGLDPANNNGYLDDTWEYDGTNQWRKINTPVHPNARSFHSMAYDPIRKRVCMYGGFGGGEYGLDDTWEYTGDGFNGTWTLVTGDPSNEGFVGTGMVWDRSLGAVVRVGGDSNPFSGNPVLGIQGDTDELVGTNWSLLVSGSGPGYGGDPATGTGYWGLGAAWDTLRADLVALGGYNLPLTQSDASAQGSVWDLLPTLTWQLDTPISPRVYPAVAYDELRNHVVVVGGDSGQAGTGNGVFEYNAASSSWVTLPPIPPNPINGADSGRAGAAMVYDSRRHVFVLMGGAGAGAEVQVPGDVIRGPGSRFSDTWELVPEQVTIDSQPADTNANPCTAVSLSVQAHGTGTVTYQWRLDGVPLPGSQYYLGANSNQLLIQPVLFSLGGNYDVVLGDDCGAQSYVTSRVAKLTVNPGPQWVLRTTNGPGPRAGAAMAYDSQRHVTVLFGGIGLVGTNVVAQNDLWEWDGTVWTLRMPNALTNGWAQDKNLYWYLTYQGGQPVPRYAHTMVYDSWRGRVVLFGGHAPFPTGFDTAFNDTWEWDGGQWIFRGTNGPGPRLQAAMAYDSDRQVSVLYGGVLFSSSELGVVWEWNGNYWAAATPPNGPPSNVSQDTSAMAYDSFRHESLFGPTSDPITPQNYFWWWDGRDFNLAGNWFGLGAFGGQGAIVFDSNRRRDVFFGGRGGFDNEYANNTTAAWDGSAWLVTPGSDQSSLFSGTDFLNPSSLVSKLENRVDPVSEFIWTNLPAATQQALSDPTATAAEQQTNLAAALNVILQGNSIYNTDRFAGIPLSTETQVLIPLFLYGADLIRFNRLLLEDAYPEIARSPSAPSTRWSHAMAYDSVRHAVVLQGGQNNNPGFNVASEFAGGETWELVAVDSPIINQQPISQVHRIGDAATFSVVAISPAGTTPRYEWFKGSQALADGGRISGSTSPQLQIAGLAASDAGLYSVSVACDCGAVASVPALLTLDPTLQEVNAGGVLTLVWGASAGFTLQQADVVTGPWTAVPGATSPFRISGGSGTKFFRLNTTGP